VNFADGKVTFRWKDYAHKSKQRLMTVTAEEFLRRFLLHTLPRGFVRIRFSGFLANRRRQKLLPLCQQLLAAEPLIRSITPASSEAKTSCNWICPSCGCTMALIAKLTPKQIRRTPQPTSLTQSSLSPGPTRYPFRHLSNYVPSLLTNSIPIALPRPPQTRAASFKRLYPK
jgi:hypothetical protein